ncbi:hypothetical protein [Haliea sp. E17]|uniref:hypothetical protein n=1 Tax=Haliea sp. E17 TaxID=3401576 RepID=UPI003AB0F317
MPKPKFLRPALWVPALLLAALLEGVYFQWLQGRSPAAAPQLSATRLETLAGVVDSALRGDPVTAAPPLEPAWESVYAALWRDGKRDGQAWSQAGPDSVFDAVSRARQRAATASDSVELSLACCFRDLDPQQLGDDLTPAQRGVRGLEVIYAGRSLRFAPTMMVAENLSFERALSRAARFLQVDGDTLLREAQLRSFEAAQVLVTLQPEPRAQQLFRGQRTLPPAAVNRDSVAQFARQMGRWMHANLHPDGRMTYMYYPGSGRESHANNMIRQWMATLALVRLARVSGDGEDLAAARRNIEYNLAHFYRREGELGIIQYKGQVKLGAVALAALALLEMPGDEYAAQLHSLVATTDLLWQDSGEFNNFLRPEKRNREANFHNFYPGETLLLWAALLQREADPGRERRFMQSVEFYRQWHRDHRRPAFVPWQTQAAYLRWQDGGSAQLSDWIFSMNDWLLAMQEHSGDGYPDTPGRFYNPRVPAYGPPHASSTGVYLEGLVDAWQLARALGDSVREQRYRSAIVQGLRSAMQLQFRDADGQWFVDDLLRTSGGLRTTVYNNVIRVDNVQHTLLAAQKILAADDGKGSLLPVAAQ